ncbi:hypothetical protein [Streptomyces sp. NPDC102264]|uniref:hypothetical protein n=1 Tax=Streptomyces sp. NPDC102264 TaxID=3366149 RepID=UPI0038144D63
MKIGGPSLTPALAKGERTPTHAVRLGGVEFGPQVESWSLDRSYGTDLPDAMRAYNGVSSTQVDLSVMGKGGQRAPALYGPWAQRYTGDVARPGQSVTLGWGVSGTALDTFRGTLRSRSAESGTDVVRMSALDGAERLRQPAELPRPDGALTHVGWEYTTPWCASPVWIVDHLLRKAGIHTAPPPRPTAILHASMHGGAAAGIGTLRSLSGTWTQWSKTRAPHESAFVAPATGSCYAQYGPELSPVNRRSDATYREFWTDTRDLPTGAKSVTLHEYWFCGGTPQYVTFVVDFVAGTLTAYSGQSAGWTNNQSVSWTLDRLKTAGKYHVGWWLSWSTTGVPTIYPYVTAEDGSTIDFNSGVLATTPAPAGQLFAVELIVTNARVEGLQMSMMPSRPVTADQKTQTGTWKRTASLDTPRFPLRAIPDVSGSAWDVITELARVTLSTAEFDSDGYFRWRDHTRWSTTPTTADVEVTSARELAKLVITEEIDACRNYCSVKWNNWASVTGVRSIAVTDKPPSPLPIQPGQTITRTYPVDENVYDVQTPVAWTDIAWGTVLDVRNSANATSGLLVSGAVEPRVTRSGGVVTMTLRNRSAAPVYFHQTVLQAATLPQGREPVPSIAAASHSASQSAYGVQTYEHDAAKWVMTRDGASQLASVLIAAGAYPVPLLQSVEILPDPRIELGDVVELIDASGARLDTFAWVVGMKVSGSNQRVTQTLTLRGASARGAPLDSGLTPDPPTRPNAPPPP